ncbi:MAG: hypothetical protein S4CHLAM123_10690 [Chlamydiales bacterium]|nr:hypothetical protein [Chlamydiales bacterium]
MSKKVLKKPKKDNSSSELTADTLKELLSSDKLSPDLGKILLSKLSKDLNEIAELRKLKQKSRSKEDLKNLIKKSQLSEEEIDKQIALHDLVLEHKETFLKILDPRKGNDKIRASGHYWDNKLKYSPSNNKQSQMTIFDLLEKPETKQKIEEVDYTVSAVGIHLTPPENKLVTALTKLLQDKSEINDPSAKNYYSGNYESLPVPKYGGTGEDAKAPVIKIKPAELYKAYLDTTEYSGAEIKVIKNTVKALADKKFLIRYERRKVVNKNGTRQRLTDLIEDFQPLIRILYYAKDLTDEELDKLKKGKQEMVEKRGEYIIALNPILVDQIDKKYVEYPRDIERRTAEAAGGAKKVTEADIALRDWFLRELSNKRYRCEINEERIPFILKLENYIKRRQKAIVQERISKSIKISKTLGLINSVDIELNKDNLPKYIFNLNPQFK